MNKTYRKRRINYTRLAIVCISVLLIIVAVWFFVSKVYNKKESIQTKEKTEFGTVSILKFENEKLNEFYNNKKKEVLSGTGNDLDCHSSLYYETLNQISCTLTKSSKETQKYHWIYNIQTNQEMSYNTIFRNNEQLINDVIKDISENDKKALELTKDSIKLGNKVVAFSGNERLFKSGNGIPSLYKQERIIPKTFPIDSSKKKIAFTFDDGPLNEYHVKIRELFNKYNIPATYYVIGDLVDQRSDYIRQSYADGHTIANHTYTHPGLFNRNLTTLSEKEIREEFEKTSDAIFKATGVDPITYRPPGGFYDERVEKIARLKTVMWDVDSEDWKNKGNAEAVYRNVRSSVYDGAIVLFHDIYKSTYEAVERLVPELIKEGYQFVSVNTILGL